MSAKDEDQLGDEKRRGEETKRGEKVAHSINDPYMYKTPDKGWAWVVAIASMLVMGLSLGIYRTLGILLVELIQVFDSRTSIASLLFMAFGISYSATALLMSTALGGIFHERGLVVIGSLLGVVCFFGTSFAKRIEHVIVLGIGVGAFSQIGLATSFSISGKYFQKRLRLANGIMMAGSSGATLLLPPIIRILLDKYTFRGTLLIISAFLMNAFVCAALLRPVPDLSLKSSTLTMKKRLNVKEVENSTSVTVEYNNSKRPSVFKTEPIENNSRCTEDRFGSATQTGDIIMNHVDEHGKFNEHINVGYDETQSTSDETGQGKTDSEVVGPNVSRIGRTPLETERKLISQVSSLERVHRNTDFGIVDYEPKLVNREKELNTGQHSTKSKPFIFRFISKALRNFFLLKAIASSKKVSFREAFGFALFKDPTFVLFQVFAFSSSLTITTIMQFYPAVVKDVGIPDSQAALLLSIIGASDISTRVFTGWFGDLRLIETYKIVMISQFILGLVVNLMFLAVNFWSHVIFSVIIGCQLGIFYTTRGILLIELFGLAALPKTVGINLCAFGFGIIVGSPLVGWLRDFTGGYRMPLHIIGSLSLSSGFLLCAIGIIRITKSRKQDSYTLDPVS